MGFLSERVSYLRGLADGMKLDQNTNEGKLLKEIIELLDDIAVSVEDMEEVQNDIQDELCTDDERINDLEDEVFGYEEDEDDFYCPYCGEFVDLDEAELNEDCTAIVCPSCGKEIDIDIDCDMDCENCECSGECDSCEACFTSEDDDK